MTPTDLLAMAQRLKAAAEKATPGPWHTTEGAVWIEVEEEPRCCNRPNYTGSDEPECCGRPDVDVEQELIAESSPENATHIAICDPTTILQLVEGVEGVVDQLRVVRAGADATSREATAIAVEVVDLRAENARLRLIDEALGPAVPALVVLAHSEGRFLAPELRAAIQAAVNKLAQIPAALAGARAAGEGR